MPVFEYAGINAQRKKTSGIIDAESEKAARLKLRRLGVYPERVSLEQAGKRKITLTSKIDFARFFQRVKVRDLSLMTRQLATLVNAGIPLADALQALVEQIEHVKLRKVITEVREKVMEGTKLSDAMRPHGAIFSDLFVNMVNAGENSGTLEIVLARLADFIENQARLRSKVAGAMTYPIVMTFVGVALLAFLLIKVVPQITGIFDDMQASLPLATRFLIGLSQLAASYWFIILILAPLVFFSVKKWIGSPKGRALYDRKVLKLPLVGNLIRMIAVSRFARTLATLLNGGVPLLASMDIVGNIVQNSVIRQAIENTKVSVQEGASVSEPLKRSGEFPPLVIHMVAIGERTGELEKMLERVADTYEMQVDNFVSTLTTLLEPIMILVMAVVVGFVVVAILLPILQMGQLMGG